MTATKTNSKPASKADSKTASKTASKAAPKLTMADLQKRQKADRWIAGTALVIGAIAAGVAGYAAYNSNGSAPEAE